MASGADGQYSRMILELAIVAQFKATVTGLVTWKYDNFQQIWSRLVRNFVMYVSIASSETEVLYRQWLSAVCFVDFEKS